jgi:hypothetical protein
MANYTSNRDDGRSSPQSPSLKVIQGTGGDLLGKVTPMNNFAVDYQGFADTLDDEGVKIGQASVRLGSRQIEFTRNDLLIEASSSYPKLTKREVAFISSGFWCIKPQDRPTAPRTYHFMPEIDLAQLEKALNTRFKQLSKEAKQNSKVGPKSTKKLQTMPMDVPVSQVLTPEAAIHLVETCLNKLQVSGRVFHAKLLCCLGDVGAIGATALELAETTNERASTTNSRLGKLKPIVYREKDKESSSYRYFLHPRISKDTVDYVFDKYFASSSQQVPLSSDQAGNPDRIDNITPESDNEESQMSGAESNNQSGADKNQRASFSAANVLINKLPEFNPGWSAEVQASWFQAYQKLVDMAQK